MSFFSRSETQERIFVEIAEKNGFKTKKGCSENNIIAILKRPAV